MLVLHWGQGTLIDVPRPDNPHVSPKGNRGGFSRIEFDVMNDYQHHPFAVLSSVLNLISGEEHRASFAGRALDLDMQFFHRVRAMEVVGVIRRYVVNFVSKPQEVVFGHGLRVKLHSTTRCWIKGKTLTAGWPNYLSQCSATLGGEFQYRVPLFGFDSEDIASPRPRNGQIGKPWRISILPQWKAGRRENTEADTLTGTDDWSSPEAVLFGGARQNRQSGSDFAKRDHASTIAATLGLPNENTITWLGGPAVDCPYQLIESGHRFKACKPIWITQKRPITSSWVDFGKTPFLNIRTLQRSRADCPFAPACQSFGQTGIARISVQYCFDRTMSYPPVELGTSRSTSQGALVPIERHASESNELRRSEGFLISIDNPISCLPNQYLNALNVGGKLAIEASNVVTNLAGSSDRLQCDGLRRAGWS